ncbi:ACP phosphodiesterase [Halomonas binhaiensis]|uniref:DUF479 domain-containing protein n=1 Tax=Halomonas binhaiensis TaxID=2562282 RepID=A0A5C1NDG5_9GAMM|nr:ACP phosphodiesterase [Halomonas binhaiensis]QEM81732.1 DUF479 domain-containing protein [Halomonas binhaiensis]
MNFLAHAWLARHGSDAFLYGNLVADGIKGGDLTGLPDDAAQGVRHHRRVDAYVDAHPVVLNARRRSPHGLQRYSGIVLDLVWDHFLCRHLAVEDRDELIERCYIILMQKPAPARLKEMVPILVREDWLRAYADFDFTCRAIRGIGTRLSGPNRLAELLPHLRHEYPRLERDFQALWTDTSEYLTARSGA